mmetsp:Transcript_13734/g.39190  ORF Transcript_13734/g.39190 Transcript_13734/m.39190 type:complete len:230 (-) Transcript_13734:1691-2380(-)
MVQRSRRLSTWCRCSLDSPRRQRRCLRSHCPTGTGTACWTRARCETRPWRAPARPPPGTAAGRSTAGATGPRSRGPRAGPWSSAACRPRAWASWTGRSRSRRTPPCARGWPAAPAPAGRAGARRSTPGCRGPCRRSPRTTAWSRRRRTRLPRPPRPVLARRPRPLPGLPRAALTAPCAGGCPWRSRRPSGYPGKVVRQQSECAPAWCGQRAITTATTTAQRSMSRTHVP